MPPRKTVNIDAHCKSMSKLVNPSKLGPHPSYGEHSQDIVGIATTLCSIAGIAAWLQPGDRWRPAPCAGWGTPRRAPRAARAGPAPPTATPTADSAPPSEARDNIYEAMAVKIFFSETAVKVSRYDQKIHELIWSYYIGFIWFKGFSQSQKDRGYYCCRLENKDYLCLVAEDEESGRYLVATRDIAKVG